MSERIKYVTTQPGSGMPQTLEAQHYKSLEMLPSGVVRAVGFPIGGKCSVEYVRNYNRAFGEMDVEEERTKPAKSR
jgi:hypothetical protein